jgi:hypothetical protein
LLLLLLYLAVIIVAVTPLCCYMQISVSATTPPVYGFLPKARIMGVNILAELDAEVGVGRAEA